jgi:hypothetical protein
MESVDFNMDDFRLNVRAEPNLPLVDAHARCFGVSIDKTQPWITVEPLKFADIIISRSTRFHDAPFDWSALEPYAGKCAFIGFPEEHDEFEKLTGMKVGYVDTLNGEREDLFLMFARVICGSKLFVGNSSFLWTLAEAMKVNRVMDVYNAYPNSLPQTANGWTRLDSDIISKCLA